MMLMIILNGDDECVNVVQTILFHIIIMQQANDAHHYSKQQRWCYESVIWFSQFTVTRDLNNLSLNSIVTLIPF